MIDDTIEADILAFRRHLTEKLGHPGDVSHFRVMLRVATIDELMRLAPIIKELVADYTSNRESAKEISRGQFTLWLAQLYLQQFLLTKYDIIGRTHGKALETLKRVQDYNPKLTEICNEAYTKRVHFGYMSPKEMGQIKQGILSALEAAYELLQSK